MDMLNTGSMTPLPTYKKKNSHPTPYPKKWNKRERKTKKPKHLNILLLGYLKAALNDHPTLYLNKIQVYYRWVQVKATELQRSESRPDS